MGKKYKYSAFTLSEMLITLVIIGVVAALTIPVFMNKAREHAYKQAWKNDFSLINNAFIIAKREADEQGIKIVNDGVVGLSFDFIDLLLTKLKWIDTCEVYARGNIKECDNYGYEYLKPIFTWSGIANIYSRYTSLNGDKVNGYDFHRKAVLLANGSSVYFGGIWVNAILIDVNNANKGPNVIGIDVFGIDIVNDGNEYTLVPFGSEKSPSSKIAGGGAIGCGADIGYQDQDINMLWTCPGIGCSYKYLYEK